MSKVKGEIEKVKLQYDVLASCAESVVWGLQDALDYMDEFEKQVKILAKTTRKKETGK